MAESWRGRQGLDQAGPYKPYKRFWYLSQETLKDFKQENDMINLHPSFFLMFIFERQRKSASRGAAEREGDTESEAGSRLSAVSTEPDTGLKPTNREIMT